jgi:hypothetical protein
MNAEVPALSAERVERRVAGRRHVHHAGHVQLDQGLVQREPVRIGHRRRRPEPPRGVGVDVAPDEAQLLDAPAQLGHRVVEAAAGRLRELADAGEVLREQPDDAADEVVADPRPGAGHGRVGDVVLHRGSLRREDHEVAAALAQHPQLVRLDRRAQLVVARLAVLRFRRRGVGQAGQLRGAELLVRRRHGGEVAVAVDDHRRASSSS